MLVLQITLSALWRKPQLFAEHYNGDGILLKDKDYQYFDNVPVKQTIWQITEPKLPLLLGQLSVCLTAGSRKIDLLTLIQSQDWIGWLVQMQTLVRAFENEQKRLIEWILLDEQVKNLFVNIISKYHSLFQLLDFFPIYFSDYQSYE